MDNPVGKRIATLTIAVVVSGFASGIATAQTTAAGSAKATAAGKYSPPRTPDGQPDISGMYEPGHIGQPAETLVRGRSMKRKACEHGIQLLVSV